MSADDRPATMPAPLRPTDTSIEADRVQIALLRQASASRRAQLALSLSASVIGAARRAIGRAHPSATTAELAARFVELHHGAELAADVRASLEAGGRRSRPPR